MFESSAPYTIEYKQDGVYLKVNPSKTIDRNNILNQVVKDLTSKGITDINKQALMLALNNASGNETKIAEREQDAKIDAAIKITVSNDKMRAFATLIPPKGGKELEGPDIYSAIRSKGIIWGVDNVEVSKLGVQPVYNESIEIAKGTEPAKGEDGKLELLFNANTEKKPKVLEDGSVDFHELNYIESVKEGQVLAKIVPPKEGAFGKNVLGQIIKAPKGKPVRIPRGKNVEIVSEGTKVVSKIDGHASFIDNKINVLNVLDISGDVDVSTGNIRFNGNIIVRGNVRSDFVIEAGGNVEVYGVVEGAVIKADGDIILKRGIQGLNKGKLISAQDIISRFAEHCTISAGNNIKTESIMHCNVNCGGSIELMGRKGLIVGGNIKVGQGIQAKVIGSPMATQTNIEIGIDPERRDRFKEAKQRLDDIQKELIHMDKSIGLLSKMKQDNSLPQHKRTMLVKLVQDKQPLVEEAESLKEELEMLEEVFNRVNFSKIKVRNKIFPGVKITIGSISKFIKDIEEFVTISLEGADIIITPYD